MYREWISAAMTGAAGAVTLAAAVVFRDQLPVPRDGARLVGFATLFGGMALFLWAWIHLGRGIGGMVAPRLEKLVVSGPYRYVRHPVYAAMTVAMVGACLVTRSAAGLLVAVFLFLPAEIHRARLEESALVEKFGEAWWAYAGRTGFMIPRRGQQ